uniref:Putative secreted protein n=1 Tax=Anopheles darlingi TaxID=43151 RepID=A0A2M4DKA2_ANODA
MRIRVKAAAIFMLFCSRHCSISSRLASRKSSSFSGTVSGSRLTNFRKYISYSSNQTRVVSSTSVGKLS